MKTIQARTNSGKAVDIVLDIINPRSCLLFSPQEKVSYMVRQMQGHHSAAAGVADATGRLIGLVTEREILRRVFGSPPETSEQQRFADEEKSMKELTAWDVMIASPLCLTSDMTVEDALSIISQYGYKYMPVVEPENPDKLVGICGEREVLLHVREKARRELQAKDSLLSYFMHHESYGRGTVLP